MDNFYETTFSDGHTVVIESENSDSLMKYLVKFYRSRGEAGNTKVVEKARTADGGLLITDTFKVSQEGFKAYSRLVDMDKE